MPKLGMGPVRRQQLIEATIASIGEHGIAGTTIARVSQRAGLSTGIVAHYFQDKAGLLEATLRAVSRDLSREVASRLRSESKPAARLLAVIDAVLAPGQLAPGVVNVWLSFWSQVGQQPRLARVQRVYERRLRSNLLHTLRSLAPDGRAEDLATGLAALIDGLWLRAALSGGALGPDEARRIVRDYLEARLEIGIDGDTNAKTRPG